MLSTEYLSEIGRAGFCMCRGVLSVSDVAELTEALRSSDGTAGVYGLRNLLHRSPTIRSAANAPHIKALVTAVLGAGARAVRAIMFDKQPGANWGVGWHQDLTIAVKQRVEVEGFTAWTAKEEVPHVQPPVDILDRMLTLRLHLDATDEDNGALVVIPGSHARGRLPESMATSDHTAAPVVCTAAAGDVLLFRPLLLHMSKKSARPTHRRVIQIEYAAEPLPPPLTWYEEMSVG
jgi:ectoine hydroxylase-related dioxygenase (phytanoyl-CoA dioxygenase family)